MRFGLKILPLVICLTASAPFSFSATALADDVKMTPELIQKLLRKGRQNTEADGESNRQNDQLTALVKKALRFAGDGKYEKAIRMLRGGVEKYPGSALIYYNLAWIYGESGNWNDALTYARLALSINPRFAGAHFLCGLAYSNLGRFTKAIEAYRKAIELDPVKAETYNNLGNALLLLKQYEAALDAYRRAIELNPSDALTYNNLGEVYRQLGRHPEAIAAYRHAIERRLDFAVAYANLGASHIALEEFEAAAEALARAVKIEPGHPDWRFNLGVIALKLSRRETAARQLAALEKLSKKELSTKLTKVLKDYDEAVIGLVRRRENEFVQALAKGDTDTLGRLLGDDYRFVGYRFLPSDKKRELKSSSLLVPGALNESITADEVGIKPVGNQFLVKGTMTIKAVSDGVSICGDFAYERVYIFENMRWRVSSDKFAFLYKSKSQNRCRQSTNAYFKQLQLSKRRAD